MNSIKELMKDTLELVETDVVFERLLKVRKEGRHPGYSTGWKHLDKFYKIPPFGQLNIVTGTPGSGKSEWLDSLAVNMVLHNKWKILVYSPENNPADFHLEKIAEKLKGKPFAGNWRGYDNLTDKDIREVSEVVKRYFVFADCQLRAGNIESIINTICLQAMTEGVNMVIIDPWNKVETAAPAGMNKTDYIGKCLSTMQMTARKYNIHIFVSAHPSKPQRDRSGKAPIPSLYDISDSAHWFNMADNGIILHRSLEDKMGEENLTEMIIAKIKDRRYGKCGSQQFRFIPRYSGFEDVE